MPRKPKVIAVEEPTSTCKSCRHVQFAEEVIFCRRFPPIPVAEGDGVFSHFPVTRADETCGEFMPRLND